VVPLVRFTGERRKMGEFANGPVITAAAWTVAVVIVGLNAWLLVGTLGQWMHG
jgi:manganese transport protein